MNKKVIKPSQDKTVEKMTKKEFIELFGEEPEDILGNDWENEIIELGGEDLKI